MEAPDAGAVQVQAPQGRQARGGTSWIKPRTGLCSGRKKLADGSGRPLRRPCSRSAGRSIAVTRCPKRHCRSQTRDRLEPWRSVKPCPVTGPLGRISVVSGRRSQPSSCAWSRAGMPKIQKAAGQSTHRLTDLLTRLVGTGETTRDTGDAHRGLRLVSETRRNTGDVGDVRRMAHSPATIIFRR